MPATSVTRAACNVGAVGVGFVGFLFGYRGGVGVGKFVGRIDEQIWKQSTLRLRKW